MSKILWVHKHPPWSLWTNSGASKAICSELYDRELLWGAIAPDRVSRSNPRPGKLLDMKLWWAQRTKSKGRGEQWKKESDGALGRAIAALPADSAVVYVFEMPEVVRKYPVRRYLFLNLSLHDAVRTGTFGHEGMTKAELERKHEDQQRMLDSVDGVITPSTTAADAISRDFSYPRDRITAFGYGSALDMPHVPFPAIERYRSREILSVAGAWQRKGGDLLYEAFQQVLESVPDAKLVIAGPDAPPVQGPGIEFLGHIDKSKPWGRKKLTALYQRAALFCMPTLCEPWGLVFSEAAQAGLPIVGAAEWSLPDIVVDGTSGVLIDKNDPAELAAGLTQLLKQPDRMCELGQGAWKRARTVLSWPRCVDRILSRVMPDAVDPTKVLPLQ